ncbi:MAG TPA: cytochrome c [Nitrospira sp.]|nr:cytochrome c [Nitrospira sp.]
MLALALVLCAVAACDSSQPKPAAGAGAVPAELQAGESKYNAHCSACHGPQAAGTQQGPPLVHKIYEPNHHGDAAFLRAAEFGVKAHHWEFGNMPKIEGVSPADVEQITRYIRWLQRQAGIS